MRMPTCMCTGRCRVTGSCGGPPPVLEPVAVLLIDPRSAGLERPATLIKEIVAPDGEKIEKIIRCRVTMLRGGRA